MGGSSRSELAATLANAGAFYLKLLLSAQILQNLGNIVAKAASATQRVGNKSLSRKLRRHAQELLARIGRQSPGRMTVSLRELQNFK